MSFNIIDVTLRDGGYRNNHAYDEKGGIWLAGGATAAGIDYVEVGYRKGPLKVNPTLGPCGLSPDPYLLAIRTEHPEARLAVMLHPKHVEDADIERLAELGVCLVRLCVDWNDLPRSQALAKRTMRIGLALSVNFTRITARPLEVTLGAMRRFEDADVIYMADSNGNMTPEQVAQMVSELRSRLKTPLGFHAHNNLSLALANSIAALKNGVTWIDASLCGMGRGAGNLATEVLATYMERVGGEHKLDVVRVLELAENWERLWMEVPMRIAPVEAALAAYNFPGDLEAPIRVLAEHLQVHWSVVAGQLNRLAPRLGAKAVNGRKSTQAFVEAHGGKR